MDAPTQEAILVILFAIYKELVLVTVVAGLYLSFYLNSASGATIVLVLTSIFFVALVFTPLRRRARMQAGALA